MVDLCDMPDLNADDGDEKNEENSNPHKHGTEEWLKVEEENLKRKWENRLNAQNEHHKKADKIWQESYEKGQKHIKEDLLMEDLDCDPNKKDDKKKISCAPPKIAEKPLDKHCEVDEFKKCIKKELFKQYEGPAKNKK